MGGASEGLTVGILLYASTTFSTSAADMAQSCSMLTPSALHSSSGSMPMDSRISIAMGGASEGLTVGILLYASTAFSTSAADMAQSCSMLMPSALHNFSASMPMASRASKAGETVAVGLTLGSSGAGGSEALSAGTSGLGVALSVTASEDAAISAISALPVSTSSATAGMPVISIAMQVAAARMRSHLYFMFTPPVSIIVQITSLIITFINELYKRAPGVYSKRAPEVHLIWVDSV